MVFLHTFDTDQYPESKQFYHILSSETSHINEPKKVSNLKCKIQDVINRYNYKHMYSPQPLNNHKETLHISSINKAEEEKETGWSLSPVQSCGHKTTQKITGPRQHKILTAAAATAVTPDWPDLLPVLVGQFQCAGVKRHSGTVQKDVAKVVGVEGEMQAGRHPLTKNADVVGGAVGHLHTNPVINAQGALNPQEKKPGDGGSQVGTCRHALAKSSHPAPPKNKQKPPKMNRIIFMQGFFHVNHLWSFISKSLCSYVLIYCMPWTCY